MIDMECKFCDIVKKNNLWNKGADEKIPIYDTIIYKTKSFLVMPDLGSIIEGYLLIITKKHLNSMAELNIEQLNELNVLINMLSELAERVYGIAPVLFEHGSAPLEVKMNAQSSINHAHMHLVPFKLENSDKIIREADMKMFNGISCLNEFQGVSYVYYRTQQKKEYITVNQSLPRQYMRRKIALDSNESDKWDWRENSFIENVKNTILSYQEILNNKNYSNQA